MYRRRLRAYAKDIRDDASYPYFIFEAATDAIDRRNNPVERAPRFGADGIARLLDGRTLCRPRTHARRRRDVDACRVRMLRLHRIEAATMLSNVASIRVLESCGFTREGLARAYLKINGRWEDHLLYARVAERAAIGCTAARRRGLMPSGGSSRGQHGASWLAALAVAAFARLRRHRPRRSPDAHSRPSRSGPHRDHDARRSLRGPRRQSAGRNRGRAGGRIGPHDGAAPRSPEPVPNWMVFALTNKTDKSLERLLTADRYTVVGSGTVWPDLDARRIESITPSVGFVPERIKNDKADVFRITLEPGQTITYVAELAGDTVFPRLSLAADRLRNQEPRSPAFQRCDAGADGPARDLFDGRFSQPITS